jgi:hypothetical protein
MDNGKYYMPRARYQNMDSEMMDNSDIEITYPENRMRKKSRFSLTFILAILFFLTTILFFGLFLWELNKTKK